MTLSTTEEYNTGAFHSYGSLINPRKGKPRRACSSEPFIKPKMCLKELWDQLLEKILSHFNAKKPHDHPKQTDFSIDDSKYILREIAIQLDEVLQLKEVSIQSGVTNGEINEEDGQTVVVQWADEVMLLQQKRKQVESEQHTVVQPSQSSQDKDNLQRVKDAEKIMSNWTCSLKDTPKESVSLREEYKAVLKDLCKQWKKGQLVNILPIMDFIIRTLLQENQSEESLLRLWFKNDHLFKKAGGLYVPDQVWNWITRLSGNITLDPDTANPNLLLSNCGKSVRSKTYKESLSTMDGHQRGYFKFDGWTCVQAVDGYTTGRHFWEVDVSEKFEWRVGVVKESAQRHGFINMNTSAGYWTLRLQLGSLMALTNPVTKLNQPTPSKLGVYLDIEEGRVAFYDSKKKRHIYTFKTDFSESEKLYPVFGTVETNRSLRII